MPTWSFQHFTRDWRFDLTPEGFWSVISRTGEYRNWWAPWLPRFSATDGLSEASVLDARIQWRRIPFGLDLRIEIEECVPARRIEAVIGGDVAGRSTVGIHPVGDAACDVHVDCAVDLTRPGYRRLLTLAGPVVDIGFEWGLTVGEAAFRRRVDDLATG